MAVHGKKAVFKLGTSGTPAVLVDLSQYFDSAGLQRMHDMAESSGLGNVAKSYVPGLRDATIPLSGRFEVVPDGQLDALDRNETLVSFEYDPGGTTVGLPKYTGQAFIQGYEVSSPVGDVVGFTCTLQVSGDVARALN